MSSEITLYYYDTSNGQAVSIMIEELREQYGMDIISNVNVKTMSFVPNDPDWIKSDWFLKITPNGRIPAITHNGLNVFETSAIINYLAQVFDKERKLSFDPQTHLKEWTEQMTWIFFAHGGVGPMFGQAAVFHNTFLVPEDVPYAKKRYIDESKRLLGVLELHLSRTGYEYLAGNRYGLADIKTYPWVALVKPGCPLGRMDTGRGDDPFEYESFSAVKAWVRRIEERPAVKRGEAYGVPNAYI